MLHWRIILYEQVHCLVSFSVILVSIPTLLSEPTALLQGVLRYPETARSPATTHYPIMGGHCGDKLALRSVLKIPMNCILISALIKLGLLVSIKPY